jgi:hypothetical protein
VEFKFFVAAAEGDELSRKIVQTLTAFFPACKWEYKLMGVEQVQQSPTKKVEVQKVLFQVTMEIYGKGLNNALVRARIIQTNPLKRKGEEIGH